MLAKAITDLTLFDLEVLNIVMHPNTKLNNKKIITVMPCLSSELDPPLVIGAVKILIIWKLLVEHEAPSPR